MLKVTETIGHVTISYEAETVQEIIELKRALNPDVLTTDKKRSASEIKELERQIEELRKFPWDHTFTANKGGYIG